MRFGVPLQQRYIQYVVNELVRIYREKLQLNIIIIILTKPNRLSTAK